MDNTQKFAAIIKYYHEHLESISDFFLELYFDQLKKIILSILQVFFF